MKPLGQFDQAYRDQVVQACTTAIIGASLDPASNVAVLRNGEVVDALMQIAATFLATSSESATPRATRQTVEKIAKRLRVQIAATRQHFTAHGMPFGASDVGSFH